MTPEPERRTVDDQGKAPEQAGPAGALNNQDRLNGPGQPGRPHAGRAPADKHVRPLFRRSIDPRVVSGERAYLLRGPDHDDLELDCDALLLARVIPLMDGTRTVEAIARDLPADGGLAASEGAVCAMVADLIELGAADDSATMDQWLDPWLMARFSRQLPMLADQLGSGQAAARAQARLAGSAVAVLGVGGIGSWAALALASAGIGRLVLADCDRVELSNLNRQILYTEADLGRLKVHAAADRISAFHSRIEIATAARRFDTASAIAEAVKGCDAVIDSLDTPAHLITRTVSEACFAAGVPVIAASQEPPHLRIGPTYVPGITGCYLCQEESYRREFPLYGELEHAEQPTPPSATFGPACGAVGTLVASEAISLLAGLPGPQTLGSALLLSLRTFEVRSVAVPRRAECRVCADARSARRS